MERTPGDGPIKSLVEAGVGIAVLTGAATAVLALLMLFVSLHYHPHCGFHCETDIPWAHWLLYGAAAGALGFVAGLPLSVLALLWIAFARRQRP